MLAKNILPLTEARKNIFTLVDEVEKEEKSFILTERGRAKAALIPITLFDRFSELSSQHVRRTYSLPGALVQSLQAPVWIARDGCEQGYQRKSESEWVEEKAYAQSILYVKLVEQFGYEPRQIEVGHPVELISSEGTQHFELDLVVRDKEGWPTILCVLIPWAAVLPEQDKAIWFLYTSAEAMGIGRSLSWLVGFSHQCQQKKGKSRAFVIDFKKYPTFALWQAGGREKKEGLSF